MTRLKAYTVHDGDDGATVIFATNSATARRQGANELDRDWTEVDSCRRAPHFDAYAPGPVPAAVLIDHGWRYECNRSGCSSWVYNDMEERCFSAGGAPYCCEACMARDFAGQRSNAAARVALQELIELSLPGAVVTDSYVYGSRLEAGEPGGGYRAFADFTFAGGRWPSRFVFGDGYRVHGDDHPAFHAAFPGVTS